MFRLGLLLLALMNARVRFCVLALRTMSQKGIKCPKHILEKDTTSELGTWLTFTVIAWHLPSESSSFLGNYTQQWCGKIDKVLDCVECFAGVFVWNQGWKQASVNRFPCPTGVQFTRLDRLLNIQSWLDSSRKSIRPNVKSSCKIGLFQVVSRWSSSGLFVGKFAKMIDAEEGSNVRLNESCSHSEGQK